MLQEKAMAQLLRTFDDSFQLFFAPSDGSVSYRSALSVLIATGLATLLFISADKIQNWCYPFRGKSISMKRALYFVFVETSCVLREPMNDQGKIFSSVRK